jgi:hypothetical protein
MNVETGRQNIIILFLKLRGLAVSFLGIYKWEPDIYIGFSSTGYLENYYSRAKTEVQLRLFDGSSYVNNA